VGFSEELLFIQFSETLPFLITYKLIFINIKLFYPIKQKMSDKYFLFKAMIIGFSFFFLRYAFYLSDGKSSRKKYFGFLAIVLFGLAAYFIYLR
jgi:hypothetical protein